MQTLKSQSQILVGPGSVGIAAIPPGWGRLGTLNMCSPSRPLFWLQAGNSSHARIIPGDVRLIGQMYGQIPAKIC